MSIAMQKQIKDNATDMREFFADLYDWTEDMKAVEERRANGAKTGGEKKFVPPPRGKVEEEKKPAKKAKAEGKERKEQEKREAEEKVKKKRDGTKMKDYYASWDKYDAEAEVEKLKEPTKPRAPNPERYEKTSGAAPNLKIRVRAGARAKLPLEIAQDLKTEANEHFSASRWFEAEDHYTKALAYAEPLARASLEGNNEDNPVDQAAVDLASILFANRAFVHLKRAATKLAVDDCDRALELQPTNLKALFRRGTARAKLKKWEEAKADLTAVVEASPTDKKAKAELEYVTRMLAAELQRRRERAMKLIADKKRVPKLPLRRIPVGVAGKAPQKAPEPKKAAAEPAAAGPAAEAPAGTPAVEPAPAKPRAKYVPKAARMAQAARPQAVAKGAGNFYAFERAWQRLTSPAERLEALRSAVGDRAEALPELFRESLSAETLASVVAVLGSGDDAFAAAVLRTLPRTKRFEVSLGLLAEDERSQLDALLARVAPDAALQYP